MLWLARRAIRAQRHEGVGRARRACHPAPRCDSILAKFLFAATDAALMIINSPKGFAWHSNSMVAWGGGVLG
jgi:hypothetical protein